MKQSVLFDMDGVIVDSMKYHANAWITVLRDYGVSLENIDIYKREGMSGINSVKDIFNEKKVSFPESDEFNALISKKHKIFEQFTIDVYPCVLELLSFLKDKNIKMALVTGSPRRSVNHMLPEAIFSMFDAIITADDVKNGKPHPDPYLKALLEIDMTPEDSLVIENAPQGVLSANNANIECYAIATTLPSPYLKGASKIFNNHKELLHHLTDVIH